MPYRNILDDAAGPVRTVTVNRPPVLNALDQTTLEELIDVFENAARTPDLRCVIVTGAGEKAFVAGADVAFMAGIGPDKASVLTTLGHRLGDLMEGLHAPIIAAVNGFALGGGLELALACDFIIASSNAKLGQPELGLGVIPGFGATQRLARRVGIARARELMYTGTILTAAEAQACALVNAVVPPADLMARVRNIAETIAARGPLAMAAAKRVMRAGEELPLSQALALEREAFAGLFATTDQKEGMKAFLEKRPPKFQGS